MHKHKDLIRYHIQSAIELAAESGLPTLRYLLAVARDENENPDGAEPLEPAQDDVAAAKAHLPAS